MLTRSCTRIDEAAEMAAASFGQVLRSISDQEIEQFTEDSRVALQGRVQELELSAQQLLRTLEITVSQSLDGFHAQMAAQLEKSIADGRADLSKEFSEALDLHRAERDENQKQWAESLDQLSAAAAEKFRERLDVTGDSFMISSVRRLNEHGQNTVESLIRGAEQSIRDSFSRVFDGLAEVLRERAANPASASAPLPRPEE